MNGCLRTRVRKQPIISLYFESVNELKFYNLEVDMLNGILLKKTIDSKRLLFGLYHGNILAASWPLRTLAGASHRLQTVLPW